MRPAFPTTSRTRTSCTRWTGSTRSSIGERSIDSHSTTTPATWAYAAANCSDTPRVSAPIDKLVARSEQPDAELRRTELVADLERLRSLVSELDESAQEALDLKYRRGFTASEISAHTGLPRATRLLAARRRRSAAPRPV